MKASYKWLQAYLVDPLPSTTELDALLTEHVFEVESISESTSATGGDDAVFEFKVLPDRAHYLLSHRGLAREIGVITGNRVEDHAPREVADGDVAPIKIGITNNGFCRRILSRRFEGVEGAALAREIVDRLEITGQRSINPLVDISNYVMFDIGQPSHILDADNIVGDIVIRNAKEGETIEILGGKTMTLRATDVVFADDQGPLEVAGVKGGARAAVTAATKNIIVHVGNYDPSQIRRTATHLDLRSDASKRFENEITPELAAEGMLRIAALIADTFPQARAGAVTDTYPHPPVARTITVSAEQVSATLGIPVEASEIADVLERMGCGIVRDNNVLTVTPPSERFDLVIPEDVADEIGRLQGYNAMPGVLPADLNEAQPQDPQFFYGEKVKSILVARGYNEALLYSFGNQGVLEIAKPLASDKAFLRENLTDRMADRLVFNKRNADLLGLDTIRLCEVGQVFTEEGEHTALALGVVFATKRKGELPEDMIREDLHALSEALGIEINNTTDTGDCGALCEINLSALISQLPAPTKLSDLGFTHLSEDKKYQKIVPYPFVTRDIAIFVPDGISVEDTHAVIRDHAGVLSVRSWLFDEFVKQIDDVVQHSYAFRIVFQSPERTLEDKEINDVMRTIEDAVRAQGWTVR